MTYCAKLVVVYSCHILMHLSGLTCWCCSPVCSPVLTCVI